MKSRVFAVLASAALAVALVACSPGTRANAQAAGSAQVATHPVSGLKVIPLVVDRGGKKLTFKVELADTPEAQAKGLMFRTELGDFEGMIFPSAVPEARAFWMKNTLIPLDMIFAGPDGVVKTVHENAVPLDETAIPGGPGIYAVLEINGGLARRMGIAPGAELRHPALDQGQALWSCVE